MVNVLKIISTVLSIYSLLCLVRIIITWIPGLRYNRFVKFLSSICDPYLNIFSNIRWLHFGNMDFSPILSLGILAIADSILQNLVLSGRISLANILSLIFGFIASLINSILFFLIIVFIIRLIVLLLGRGSDSSSSIWNQLDRSLGQIVFKISKFFSGGKPVNYRNAIIISIIVLIICNFLIKTLFGFVGTLISRIPF